MDLGDILILLLFLAPALRRIFGGKKQKKARPALSPEESTQQEIEDPIAEALRQIREALGEEEAPRREGVREVSPPEEAAYEPEPWRSPMKTEEFREVGEFEHEAHGFGRENPISEEVFEQRPAFVAAPRTAPIEIEDQEAVDLTAPLEVKTQASTAGTALQDILRDPQRARDAFILHEVFDAPRSHKPWRRR